MFDADRYINLRVGAAGTDPHKPATLSYRTKLSGDLPVLEYTIDWGFNWKESTFG
jgi:hypothetical protein